MSQFYLSILLQLLSLRVGKAQNLDQIVLRRFCCEKFQGDEDTSFFNPIHNFVFVRHDNFLMMMLFAKDLSTGKTKDMDLP